MVQVGDRAPDFKRDTAGGEKVSLSELNAEGKSVVLFFYPKDESPVCTKEACHFRDQYEDFVDAGAVVIGVSSDGKKSHQKFSENHALPFHLISDAGSVLRKAFAVRNDYFLIPGRVTFVIDKAGVVRHRFESPRNALGHVEEALATVRELMG